MKHVTGMFQIIEESDGKEFADGFVIEVAVTGPRMPNTTLVDLPGFTTSSPEDAQIARAGIAALG